MAKADDAISARGYSRWAAITPSDTTQYGLFAQSAAGAPTPTEQIDALYVVVTGQITLAGSDNVSQSFGATVPVGTILPLSPRRVLAATAATLLALFR